MDYYPEKHPDQRLRRERVPVKISCCCFFSFWNNQSFIIGWIMETNSLRHLFVRDINCGHYSDYRYYSLSRLLNEQILNELNSFLLYVLYAFNHLSISFLFISSNKKNTHIVFLFKHRLDVCVCRISPFLPCPFQHLILSDWTIWCVRVTVNCRLVFVLCCSDCHSEKENCK